MEENTFIEKFKTKTTFELKQIIENPSAYENKAVEAAQHHISNPTIKIEIKEKPVEPVIPVEPVFKEKAFFKQKGVFWLAIVGSLFSTILSFVLFNIYGDSLYLIWVIILVLFFAVLISKSLKTVLYLKALSIASISFIATIYLFEYISLAENAELIFKSSDFQILAINLAFLLEGGKLIEIKKIQTN
jgi:hypothetical protein